MSKLRNLCTRIIGFSIAGPALDTNMESIHYPHTFTGKLEHDNQYDERVHVDENATGLFDFQ